MSGKLKTYSYILLLPTICFIACVAVHKGADISLFADTIKILFNDDSKKELIDLKAELDKNANYSFDYIKSEILRIRIINTNRPVNNENTRTVYKHIQIFLSAVGYYNGVCDGDQFSTYKALTEFQSKHNLQPDGIIGKKTWKAMEIEFDKKRVD